MTTLDWGRLYDKFYSDNRTLYELLETHSRCVADKSLAISAAHPELGVDECFLEEAAMLHDIGIFLTDAEPIHCFGTNPYIAHGFLGAELLRGEGLPRHALVCERHTGTGLTLEEIEAKNLPIPHRDMQPVSIEEIIICFADKFYSKTRPDEEKTVAQVEHSLSKFGERSLTRFREWCELFR